MTVPTSQTVWKNETPPKKGTFKVVVTRTTALWPRKVFVQWIVREPKSTSGHLFSLYRSGSSEGPWETLFEAIPDIYYHLDENFPAPSNRSDAGLFSLRRTLYYKVVVSHPSDGVAETVQKLEASLDRRRQGIVRKLRRDAAVMLHRGSGTEVAILKRKWWGEPCEICRSSTGQTTRSHCSSCHGTGIVYGYWDPVYGFATRSATPVDVGTESQGNVERHQVQVKMMDIPEVERYDILVFLRDNKRYIIDQVLPTEIHTVNVHQELVVSELARSSNEYALEVDPWRDPGWF